MADLCGWTKIGWYEDNAGPGFWHGIPPTKLNANWEVVDQDSKPLPDVLNDLNAVHLAELALTDEQYRLFHYELHRLRNNDCMPICKCHSAPSAHRVEAILRATGRWIEDKDAEVRRFRTLLQNPVVKESSTTAPAGCAAPEIQSLIKARELSCLESAAREIKRLKFVSAWSYIDEAQIYRKALLK